MDREGTPRLFFTHTPAARLGWIASLNSGLDGLTEQNKTYPSCLQTHISSSVPLPRSEWVLIFFECSKTLITHEASREHLSSPVKSLLRFCGI